MSSKNIDPDLTATRARRFLRGYRPTAADNRESTGRGGSSEAVSIAAAIMRSAAASSCRQDGVPQLEAAAPGATMTSAGAMGMAEKLVAEATKAMEALDGGAPAHTLRPSQVLALEAVVKVKDRPAIRFVGNDLEDLALYPEAETWAAIVDTQRAAILAACRATGAVHVIDKLAGSSNWVQGTAWMLSPTKAITNRHVLFPPMGGTRLARRVPGTTAARLRKDLEVKLDLTFHTSPPSPPVISRVVDVLFVAAEDDPVDAALLKVEPLAGQAGTLTVTREPLEDLARLYVVGHPGLKASVSEDESSVFGNPDAKKRVSFGETMAEIGGPLDDIVHDASTIGGYSGGCVMDFMTTAAAGLHYWGDTVRGNRAVSAAAIVAHPQLSRLLPQDAV